MIPDQLDVKMIKLKNIKKKQKTRANLRLGINNPNIIR